MSYIPGAEVIRQTRKTPLVITSIILELLRGHFGNNSPRFHWVKDPAQTKVILDPINKLDFEVVQKRPAVYVARGPIAFNRVAIDDLAEVERGKGILTYAKIATCTVSCLPVSKEAGEVELLAEEVSDVLNVFTSIIKKDFNFQKFDLGVISPIGVVQENREFFTTPVTVGLQWEEIWTVEQFSVPLRAVLVHLNQTLIAPYGGTLYSCGEPNEVGCGEEPSNQPGPPFGEGGYGA